VEARPVVPPLDTRPLCRIEATVGPIISVGAASYGQRRVVQILGGRVQSTGDGQPFSGEILPGGNDWQTLRADGVLDIEARYVLQLDGGALVEVLSQGYRYGPAAVIERMARGEIVDPGSYFFRTFLRFQTGSTKFAEFNRTLGVARAQREPERVRLDVFRVH